MESDLLPRLVVLLLQACRRVLDEAWGDAENDSRAQRNTEEVDPSTNRRRGRDAAMRRRVGSQAW